ncbi:hypothetical protein CRUP_036471, partial [Coryphaenoides rupestris]
PQPQQQQQQPPTEMEDGGEGRGQGPLSAREEPCSGHRLLRRDSTSSSTNTTTTNLLASVKEQLEEERQIVASQLERCMLGADSSEKSFAWRSADTSALGESRGGGGGGASETPVPPARLYPGEESLRRLEPERASLHDSEVDSLLYVLKSCVNTADYDSKIVENSVCTLRNLSYRLEVEMPSSRLLGNQELDALLGFSSPARELDYLCLGKRRRGGGGAGGSKRRSGWTYDKWEGVGVTQTLRGAELLWHPTVVRPYLNLLAE